MYMIVVGHYQMSYRVVFFGRMLWPVLRRRGEEEVVYLGSQEDSFSQYFRLLEDLQVCNSSHLLQLRTDI